MTETFEQLIDLAIDHAVNSNIATVYALIAIAQELHRENEQRANNVEQRMDLAEARVERLANLAG